MRTAGFTLVELAIVLVIIGLLVGGVLVGADLVKSAQINATVSDIQSYTAAALTFRDKYGGIPGDLRNDKAAQAGLTVSATSPGTVGEGDGDGYISNYSGGLNGGAGGEVTLFWRQLSDAGLISFKSVADGTTIDTSAFGTGSNATTGLTGIFPPLRIRPTGFINISAFYGGSSMTGNIFTIAAFNSNGSAAGVLKGNPTLSAREALGLDQKLDDGYPATGTVLSRPVGFILSLPGNGGTPSTANTLCYDNTTTAGSYAVAVDDNVRCLLVMRPGI
ncbi:MAG: prepilin-type N-terminal cleavage/methylation domain-containing protein [Alphaproteobacteria bacterium]